MVPEGWHMEILKNIVDGGIKNGYSPNASEKVTGHWVLGLGALGDSGLITTEIKPVEATQKILNCCLNPGDFLVSRSNTPDKVGRSVLFKGEIDNCSYPDLMMRFRVNEGIVDAGFIEAKLKSYLVRGYFKRCAAGSSSTMVKINKSIIENTPLLLPPLFEQKKIARILSTWDKAIETVEKLIKNSKAQKKVLMQQLLTGKRRLPGFDGEWTSYKLSEISNPQQWPTISSDQLCEEGYPVYGANGFIGYFNEFNHENETVTVTCRGSTCGEVTLIPPRSYITGNSMSIDEIDSRKCSHLFLYYVLIFRGFRDVISGSAQPQIVGKDIKSVKIQLPSLVEQQKIATILTTADKEIETLQQRLDCLKQEKKALMQQLLTGKRRVKVSEDELQGEVV